MNGKPRGFLMAIGIGFIFFLGLGTITMFGSSEEKPLQIDRLSREEGVVEAVTKLPLFISLAYPSLERPPVQFYHDKHTKALKEEGCGICHPENKDKDIKGRFIYSYPKIRDEKNKETLMNSYHSACIGCHEQRIKEGRKSGAVTCGECHVKQEHKKIEYLAIKPEYYQASQDVYHQDCLACHKEGKKLNKEAKPLPWGDFYVQIKKKGPAGWPQSGFDYYLHYKHDKALEKQCELCHHIGRSSCRDCHKQKAEGGTRSFKEVAHDECISCHMERKKEGKKGGPFTCEGCHTGKRQRTIEEMTGIPRPDIKQKDHYLISVDEATLKAVPFNHKAHEGYTRSCRDCHHQTIKSCKTCHTLKGNTKEGGGVTLAESYHEMSSKWSCIGCHESKKSEPSCAGCHHLTGNDLSHISSCGACHRGPEEETQVTKMLPPPDNLLPEKLGEELKLGMLEKTYKAAKFPHLRIIQKLTEISNEDKLARRFHTQRTTICAGCHHYTPMEEKKPLPPCSTCHSIRREPRKSVPTLFGAYHRQCLGCHEEMGLEVKPRDCTKCHEQKPQAGIGVGK